MPLTDEYIANSRFRVLDTPAAAPGKCAVCGYAGGESNRKFVDFGLSVEFFGAVYLCTECLTAVAVQIGMSNKHSVDEIDALRRFYEAERQELRDLVSGEYLDTCRDLFEQHLSALRHFFPDRSVSVSEGTPQNSVEGTTGSQQSGESISVEGRNDFPGNSSDGADESDFDFGFNNS